MDSGQRRGIKNSEFGIEVGSFASFIKFSVQRVELMLAF